MIMKLKPALAASLFALMAALSLNASAAADTPANTKVEKAAPQKHLRPDFRYEEKAALVQKARQVMPDKLYVANDKTKDYHPRDGK
jgi:hypothetical protein